MERIRGSFARLVTPVGVVALVAVTTLAVPAAGPAGATEVRTVPASGVWTVDGHGNGHGHGLSQYGARGAAIAGLNYAQIVGFYYPGTTLATAGNPNIRVLISGDGGRTQIKVQSGLTATGVSGTLPTSIPTGAGPTPVNGWQVLPSGAGSQLQVNTKYGWSLYKNLPSVTTLTFQSSTGMLNVVRNGVYAPYRGTMSSVRNGSGTITVNTLSLENYLMGVVPSEMPASWQAAAVQAQAVAARSYSDYYVGHPRAASYDICDTTSCQVYGGMNAEYSSSNAAVAATAGKVLSYGGSVIFAEFSASNGGMTSSGNEPYFVTKPDPYDNAGTGDPYLNWTVNVTASHVAAYYGLDTVTQIQITAREGGGQWGGLVSTATVSGTSGGVATSISVSGAGLASAMGLSYRYFYIRPFAPTGHVDQVAKTALHTVQASGWTLDPTDTSRPASVDLVLDGVAHRFAANTYRPDVQQALHTSSPYHGFVDSLTVPGGSHTLCGYAVAINGTDRTGLGCTTITVPVSPIGHVEALRVSGATVTVAGWEFDPDVNGGPGRVHVYVDGSGYPFNDTVARPDVQRAYGLTNATEGFSVSVPLPAGTHRVCVYGINQAGAGANTTLYCATVTR